MGLANWLGLQSNINTDPYAVQRNNFAYGGYENGANDATARLQGMGAQAQQRGLTPPCRPSRSRRASTRTWRPVATLTPCGPHPSVAQLQMQRGLQQAQQNAQSMAAGARVVAPTRRPLCAVPSRPTQGLLGRPTPNPPSYVPRRWQTRVRGS